MRSSETIQSVIFSCVYAGIDWPPCTRRTAFEVTTAKRFFLVNFSIHDLKKRSDSVRYTDTTAAAVYTHRLWRTHRSLGSFFCASPSERFLLKISPRARTRVQSALASVRVDTSALPRSHFEGFSFSCLPFAILAAVIRCVWKGNKSSHKSQEAVKNLFILLLLSTELLLLLSTECLLDSEEKDTTAKSYFVLIVRESRCHFIGKPTPSAAEVVCQLHSNIISSPDVSSLLLPLRFECEWFDCLDNQRNSEDNKTIDSRATQKQNCVWCHHVGQRRRMGWRWCLGKL
jgi:hypothetical protein